MDNLSALSENELRRLAAELLLQKTARDKQTRVGASNLSDPCDYCLASNLLGDMRENGMASRAYFGRIHGTAIHGMMERNLKSIYDPSDWEAKLPDESIFHSVPSVLTEQRLPIGILGSYGEVWSTADVILRELRQLLDWKTITMAKLAVLVDYVFHSRGLEPPYGRQFKAHKLKTLSEKAYAEAVIEMAYKVLRYKNQTSLYGFGCNTHGLLIEVISLIFIARDVTGWFDYYDLPEWDDPKKEHGIYALNFAYDHEFALGVWGRALRIWEAIEAGAIPSDFERHELCFNCSMDLEQEQRMAKLAETIEIIDPQSAGAQLALPQPVTA